ncbi:hypothetical protein BG011_000538 [Mortierella polycephala]|uniref:Aminotransferase class V domain-containing protein n=1 Tax=Mortierella polycephala TaxID=41804 RepID=A0A9P6U727_9FUNG|nr:hypothetical protein BG011_000538 [Mortierella polycephala]
MNPDTAMDYWVRLSKKSTSDFLKSVQDVIASPDINDTPFGRKKSTYTDWFASGKSLHTIEKIMLDRVLPFYANTHTGSTSTARYTSACVHNSRATIARCLNAQTEKGHPHEAAMIFCGDGSTSAILKVRNAFRLADEAYWVRKAHATEQHHSNLLPWRESVADVIVIHENADHQLDLQQLEHELIRYRDRPLKLGTFSAGSNLTGVLNDTDKIAEILHMYGAFAFFDYAGVGAYTTVDMNPQPSGRHNNTIRGNLAYKDGVFLSPHKMVGGPGSSGILAVRLEIFSWAEENSSTDRNELIPTNPGGGTVDMVIRGIHKYSNNVLAREEAGTPNILATIRAGLVYRLQEITDPRLILAKEHNLAAQIYNRLLESSPNITILGTPILDRVAVFCVLVSVPQLSLPAKPLQIHHLLLSMIMNDFFGIEMRSGCMCAGPYASQLLKFDAAKEAAFWKLLLDEGSRDQGVEYRACGSDSGQRAYGMNKVQDNIHQHNLASPSLKPGFVRFSFPYFVRNKDIAFVVESLEWVAKYGFLLIPLYRLDATSGTWSVRPALRQTICQDINSKRLKGGRRSDYTQVATDSIYGLYKILEWQRKEAQPASVLNKMPHKSTPQASDIAMNVLRRPSKWSLPIYNISYPTIIHSKSSFVSTFRTFIDTESTVIGSDSDAYPLVEYSSDSEPGDIASLQTPVRAVSSVHASDPKKSAAMEDISWQVLEAEARAVDNNALARQLRWFVTPLEVAELYISEIGSKPLSFFPSRVAKRSNGKKGRFPPA